MRPIHQKRSDRERRISEVHGYSKSATLPGSDIARVVNEILTGEENGECPCAADPDFDFPAALNALREALVTANMVVAFMLRCDGLTDTTEGDRLLIQIAEIERITAGLRRRLSNLQRMVRD